MSRTPLAVILAAARTPIGTFGGAFKDVSAADLGAAAAREVLTRSGVGVREVDDVFMGCVLQAGSGMNVARQAALKAGLPVTVPAATVNRVCGSGLQAVVHAVESIRGGYATVVLAGGVESMSRAPYVLKNARWGLRLGHGEVEDTLLGDGLTCAIESCHMGITAEEVAQKFGVSREDQDAFAAESQARAERALAEKLFRDEIVPVQAPGAKGAVTTVDRDEHPRPGTTVARLAGLKPAFTKDGSVTAGNASGLNDGAACTVVASPSFADGRSPGAVARILSYAVVGVEPKLMGIGPVSAVRLALERAGLAASDVHLFELNEAFAAQSVAVVRELGLDPAKVNTRGGAIALGHPIGASGARVLTTLIYALRARGGGLGVASLCIGGGMGIAMTVEV
jgi:acetyl-CoA C-acetyltransferase